MRRVWTESSKSAATSITKFSAKRDKRENVHARIRIETMPFREQLHETGGQQCIEHTNVQNNLKIASLTQNSCVRLRNFYSSPQNNCHISVVRRR
nr:PREDICTED: uncharacterized protein LOC105662455 isoform X2 [Megachile rotundata]